MPRRELVPLPALSSVPAARGARWMAFLDVLPGSWFARPPRVRSRFHPPGQAGQTCRPDRHVAKMSLQENAVFSLSLRLRQAASRTATNSCKWTKLGPGVMPEPNSTRVAGRSDGRAEELENARVDERCGEVDDGGMVGNDAYPVEQGHRQGGRSGTIACAGRMRTAVGATGRCVV